jgi:glycosyltransferase involved in cell wall biosynthesis
MEKGYRELENALVSVVVPTYNRESTIVRSINSILEQTYQNLECIIVDDGSSDHTKDVVSQIEDSRVRYIKLNQNRGPSVARNVGIRESRGDYIAFNDSDDLWLPDKLEIQMAKLEAEAEAGMIYCSYLYRKDGKEYQVPSEKCTQEELEGEIFASLWDSNKIGTPTILIKKECIKSCGAFSENLHSLEDWEFVLRISRKYKISYVNKILVHTHYSPKGVNEQYELQVEAIWQIMNQYQQVKGNDPQMVRLLLHKLALISEEDRIAYWEEILVPSVIASKMDFRLILTYVREQNKAQKINSTFARMADLDKLTRFISTNIDLENEKFAIYGAGNIGIFLARLLDTLQIHYEYVIDRAGGLKEGFHIVKPCMVGDDISKVIVTIAAAADGMVDLQLPAGVKMINIFDIILQKVDRTGATTGNERGVVCSP